jgi:hypothetical protein
MKRLHVLLPVFLLWTAGCGVAIETAQILERPERQPTVTEMVVRPPVAADLTFIAPGRFDTGKMWTFDNPPLEYLEEEYGFRPDEAWMEKARMGALRFGENCSASFVSHTGLVLTNHHCARESITDVTREGENLVDSGFFATTMEEERRVETLFLDQLLTIDDVTQEIVANISLRAPAAEQADARRRRQEALQERLTDEARQRDTTLHVQVIELYKGGQYSAYTFRRFHDVRLVMAPELRLGYFGGDMDNFTYPRYSLDFTFFRVYSPQGAPIQPEHYFSWSSTGAADGEPVFVVGNPGSTSRLITVAQMEFLRDHVLPQQVEALRLRALAMEAFFATVDDPGDYDEVRNAYLSITNSVKALSGQLAGLRDPALIARRRAAETAFIERVATVDTVQIDARRLINDVAALQRTKSGQANQLAALMMFGSPVADSRLLTRALYGYAYALLAQRGAPTQQLESLREDALKIRDWPLEVEERMITERLEQLRSYLGEADPTVRRVLQGREPAEVASMLVRESALVDSAAFAGLLNAGFLASNDASVPVIQALGPIYFTTQQQQGALSDQEAVLNAALARARFAVYGREIPPDASFSLRLADGRVAGYVYNGTLAPPVTTMFGLFERHHVHPDGSDWTLPERWLTAEPRLDRRTPLNLVSTNDITGGNSGSPLLNSNLELVGLIFDGNIESLPNEFLYTDEVARAISVDARGIMEALRAVYGADRIIDELEAAARAANSRGYPEEEVVLSSSR